MVLAPHQFSQLHKTSSKTSFTTTTEISHSHSLVLPSSTKKQQVTNSFNQDNPTKMDDSVTEDNNHKIPHSLDSENEGSFFNEPETTLRLTVPDHNTCSTSELKHTKRKDGDSKEAEDESGLKTRESEKVAVDRQQSMHLPLLLFLIVLFFSLLGYIFGNRYFTSENRCQTFGLRMDWNSGPPPT